MVTEPGPAAVPIRDAATVVLVRDGDTGMEAFMLRRSARLAFTPGAYVFPGGAVDPADLDPRLLTYCAGRTDAETSALLDLPREGLAFWVAGIRECFEEAGVLLARRSDGSRLDLDDPANAARFRRHRAGLNAGRLTLLALCAAEQLVLDLGAVTYFAHWLTPAGAPRRYDTRFLLAAAPPGQAALHDDGEAVEGVWVRPADALARWPGEDELIRPTRVSLEAFTRFSSVADLLAAAHAMEREPGDQPRMGPDGQGVRIRLPGDPGWPTVGREGAVVQAVAGGRG